MRNTVLICAMALIAGCGTNDVTRSSTGMVPRIKSQLTVAQANQVLRTGMSAAEVAQLTASVPTVSMWTTRYWLADGGLSCQWEDGKLKAWSTTREGEP